MPTLLPDEPVEAPAKPKPPAAQGQDPQQASDPAPAS